MFWNNQTNLSENKLGHYLGESTLLVNEGQDVHGFDGDHIQRFLVVDELDMTPADRLVVILLLQNRLQITKWYSTLAFLILHHGRDGH